LSPETAAFDSFLMALTDPADVSASFSAVIFLNTDVGVKARGVGDDRCFAGDEESLIFAPLLFVALLNSPDTFGERDLKLYFLYVKSIKQGLAENVFCNNLFH
jgi:hypothetical protein